MGQARAHRAAHSPAARIEPGAAVVLAGISGRLDPGLEPGEIVVATSVRGSIGVVPDQRTRRPIRQGRAHEVRQASAPAAHPRPAVATITGQGRTDEPARHVLSTLARCRVDAGATWGMRPVIAGEKKAVPVPTGPGWRGSHTAADSPPGSHPHDGLGHSPHEVRATVTTLRFSLSAAAPPPVGTTPGAASPREDIAHLGRRPLTPTDCERQGQREHAGPDARCQSSRQQEAEVAPRERTRPANGPHGGRLRREG
jgi:hypothetical protein